MVPQRDRYYELVYEHDIARIARPRGLTPGDIVPAGLGRTDAALLDCWSRVFRLRRRTLVGRDVDIVDIAILDDAVSLYHADLWCDADGWVVVDHGSTNGTFVDGMRVRGRARVRHRQVITFGDVGFVFLARHG